MTNGPGKNILAVGGLVAAVLTCIPLAYGQSLSARGNTAGMAMGGLQGTIAQVSADLAQSQQQIHAMETCLADHAFYAPDAPDADASGCVSEQDPKVAEPVPDNSICTSDGAQVKCLQVGSNMVFTRTYVSNDTGPVRTATVYCPAGTLRLGCGGGRGWSGGAISSGCSNGTCGLLGIMPLDDTNGQGCQVAAKTTTEEPAVVATCFNPAGGTDETGGNLTATAPPQPPDSPPAQFYLGECHYTSSGNGRYACGPRSNYTGPGNPPWPHDICSGQLIAGGETMDNIPAAYQTPNAGPNWQLKPTLKPVKGAKCVVHWRLAGYSNSKNDVWMSAYFNGPPTGVAGGVFIGG